MAYFAKLGIGNVVTRVTVVNDDIATTEQAGADFLNELFKTNDIWKQTWIDGSQRKNYAGLRISKYDAARDAFIFDNAFPSWVLNEDTCRWEPPIPYPDSGVHTWNEDTESWDSRE